jgi:urocanate hydratase
LQLVPQNEILARWLRTARKHVRFQGLPARVAWLDPDERAQFGRRVNDLVARGELKTPVVISRDYASSTWVPLQGLEGKVRIMDDASGQAILRALREATAGAAWASIRCGADSVTKQASLLTQAVVADGTTDAAQRLSQILRGNGKVR